ncbi:cytosolic protein [Hungatella hominis]|uniref:Cytosolic protein n=1 Tax=Hungatella hominis TaxID=2763050 RepID=A0ABR7H6M1_9FIRM|nr:cytosolic protein [Hungatella hominis]MBC5708788.1 cytosolic protein [Hungatella hominis]
MEEQTLAELLYDSAFSVKKQRKGRSEEQKIWASFLALLNQELDASGCGAKAETYTESEPYRQACGYHRDYGYFMVSCGDRGSSSITILEEEAEAAKNRFLAFIIEKKAYEWVVKVSEQEEAFWKYHCRYDYRRLWFGKALEWLAPAVDWAFFAQCAERYIELLNRWFARPHWEYDYQISRIIEISESREYSDSKYLYRIEPAKEPDHSRIRLEPQFLEDGGSSGAFSFEIEGEALDMRRLEEEVLVLMDREENNIDAYSLEGRFLWNIGEKLPVHRRYDNLYEDICG